MDIHYLINTLISLTPLLTIGIVYLLHVRLKRVEKLCINTTECLTKFKDEASFAIAKLRVQLDTPVAPIIISEPKKTRKTKRTKADDQAMLRKKLKLKLPS